MLQESLLPLSHRIIKSGGITMQNELERHAIAQGKAFDANVVTWLSSQDDETKQRINDMVRHIMALKRV